MRLKDIRLLGFEDVMFPELAASRQEASARDI
jgi:hypothetical protein